MIDLRQGDCLELMQDIPDGSVDLILTDPPYGTMAGAPLDGWVKREDTAKWDVAIPPNILFPKMSRILRQNGKAVLFSQEPYTSKMITFTQSQLSFCYRAMWYKNVHANSLLAKSAMVNRFEDICIFAKPHDPEGTNELRTYFKNVLEYVGKTKKEIVGKLGQKADHCFRIYSSQYSLCAEKTYTGLVDEYGIDKMPGFLPYSELKEINRRYEPVFNLWQGGKSKSNVLEYPKDTDHYHPTQKPVALLEDLIQTYSNPGDTVMDFTMGSGSTGVACVNTNRNFIGIELDESYFEIAKKRIEDAQSEWLMNLLKGGDNNE